MYVVKDLCKGFSQNESLQAYIRIHTCDTCHKRYIYGK